MEDTGNYYLISHLVLLTGLTDRTIRNYISSGILQGENCETCMILDFPGRNKKEIADFFVTASATRIFKKFTFPLTVWRILRE